ncbi:hypothetical protein GpartN1_g2920.t1 [Galdieria partita]|uniref:Glycosyl transferase family 1 domain-containing protein n=1 Tax=Galdieria partita TaxID=83374 RepID=A0A9C7PVB8_9RHOD|nr:hypothetical protein GpartN1_g2920.t1 [Galdieria partita]
MRFNNWSKSHSFPLPMRYPRVFVKYSTYTKKPLSLQAVVIIVLTIAIHALFGYYLTRIYLKSAHPNNQPVNDILDISVLWLAPFLSGSGYGAEALSFIQGLHKHITNLTIYHFGDIVEEEYLSSLSEETEKLLKQLWAPNETLPSYFIKRQYEDDQVARKLDTRRRMFPDGTLIREPILRSLHDVVIVQSIPRGWEPYLFETAKYRVGRTVFETDRLPDEWAQHCNNEVDEVWVPTEFNVKTFAGSGVKSHMLHVLPQTVDTNTFSHPSITPRPRPPECLDSDFIFLSVFRWGGRKGTEFLLEAFLREFSPEDSACLVILTATHKMRTNATYYHGLIHQFANDLGITSAIRPRIAVLEPSISNQDMPGLYAMANAFVLVSRGEGWGRPYTEAMMMNVPVIATNWSAHTEFITPETGYLVKVDKLDLFPSDDEEMMNYWGHLLARPSICHLRQVMRFVKENPQDAKRKAINAKQLISTRFNQNAVTNTILNHLKRIKAKLTTENVEHMLATRAKQIIAQGAI